MRPTALVIGAVAVAVAAAGGLYAASREVPPMSAPDARRFTERALAAAGAGPVEATGRVRAETFTTEDGREVEVWVVPARVRGRRIELYVARRGDEAVNLDDEVVPGRHVLTDRQFAALDRFRHDPAGERARRRQLPPAVAAGALALLAGGATAMVARRGYGRPT